MFKSRQQDSSRSWKEWATQDPILLAFTVSILIAGLQSIVFWQSVTVADFVQGGDTAALSSAKTAVTVEVPSGGTSSAYIDPPRTRDDLGALLESRDARIGAELGVQRGHFTLTTLRTWKSCIRYYLVDVWQHQVNYEDVANVPQEVQDKLYNEARNNLQQHNSVVLFYRNFTSDAAKLITEPLDYVYVDARHDYCGVMEDISLYWPKIKSGGIMAGHDYVDATEAEKNSGQHWEKCLDGSVHPGAVRGAVNEFFKKLDIPVYVTYQDAPWSSWIVVKP